MSSGLSRRAVLAGCLLALPASAACAAPDSGPAAPIAALDDALLAAMKAGRGVPFAQRAATLTPAIQRSFDLPAILQASIGLRYAGFSAADKAALLDAFTGYTVASYAANFDNFAGERFAVAAQTRAVGSEQVVQTQILPAHGDPIRLDYVMRQGVGGWQAVDVLVDGSISRVAVQRSDFRSLLASGGAANLIASLQTKAARLASGGNS